MGLGAEVTALGRHPLEGAVFLDINLDCRENWGIISERAARTDILCCVRGPFLQKCLEDTTAGEWDAVVGANLVFPGMLVSAALPHMMESGWGRIAFLGGTRTDIVRGFKTNAVYGAAKIGLSSLVCSVSEHYGRYGITCNAVCPGFVDTEYTGEQEKKVLAAKNPDGELISAEDVAESLLFLMKNPVYNGVVLKADKGWHPKFG
jgi:NAD(P)-dependent dehydrogenase (short-subunit alcohol dehydrogenase family)